MKKRKFETISEIRWKKPEDQKRIARLFAKLCDAMFKLQVAFEDLDGDVQADAYFVFTEAEFEVACAMLDADGETCGVPYTSMPALASIVSHVIDWGEHNSDWFREAQRVIDAPRDAVYRELFPEGFKMPSNKTA
jgi:hypothetical protein